MPGGNGTVIGSAARAVVETLRRYDIDGRDVARAAGLPQEALDDPEATLSSDTLDRFVAMAAEASGEPSRYSARGAVLEDLDGDGNNVVTRALFTKLGTHG